MENRMRNLTGKLSLENQVLEVRGYYTTLGKITTATLHGSVRQLEANWPVTIHTWGAQGLGPTFGMDLPSGAYSNFQDGLFTCKSMVFSSSPRSSGLLNHPGSWPSSQLKSCARKQWPQLPTIPPVNTNKILIVCFLSGRTLKIPSS